MSRQRATFARESWQSARAPEAGLGLALALAMFGGSALAGVNGADVQKDFPVSFTLSSADCPNLPPGTTITGSGSGTSVTTNKTDASGVTTSINTTHESGTATDQAGNTYVWSYSNHSNLTNSLVMPDFFSGTMEDHFSLAGNGPANLSNGFLVDITFGPNPDWPLGLYGVPRWVHGDAFPFPFGVGPGCDPL